MSHVNFECPPIHPVGQKRFSLANFGPRKSSSRTRINLAIALVQKYACIVRTNCSKCPTGLVGRRYEIVVAWLSRQDELFQMSNWTGRPKVRRRGGMAQSVEHIVHIDGVVDSSPTVTTKRKPLQIKGLFLFTLPANVKHFFT